MKEMELIRILAVERCHQQHKYITPHFTMPYGNIIDLFSVTKSGYSFDHEIKTSRADFKADFKKWKHIIFTGQTHWTGTRGRPLSHYANYFVFVTMPDLVSIDEIPEYAGLYEIDKTTNLYGNSINIVKKPKLLHKGKIGDAIRVRAMRRMQNALWRNGKY